MKKTKKFLILVLVSTFMFSMSMFLLSCATVTIKTKEPLKYHVGENVHVFDLFEYQADVDYEFYYSVSDGEDIKIEGESFFLVQEGEYVVKCNVQKGISKSTAKVSFLVTEKSAYMVLGAEETAVEYERTLTVRALINRSAPKVVGNMEHSMYVEDVTIYKKGIDGGVNYKLIDTIPIPGDEESAIYKSTNDGFFDGNKFFFKYECEYVFTIVVVTTGGTTKKDFKVTAKESISDLSVLSGLQLNRETLIATWQPIDSAVIYRVKAGSDSIEITQTSIDLKEILPEKDFHYFDLAVIPKDASNNKLGVMIEKDVIVTPEGSEGIIEGVGASINAQEKTVVLSGKESYSAGWNERYFG